MSELDQEIEKLLYEKGQYQSPDDAEDGLWVPEVNMEMFKSELFDLVTDEVERVAKTYGAHLWACQSTHDKGDPCDCGLAALRGEQ